MFDLCYVLGGLSFGLVVVVVFGVVMFLFGIDMVGFGCVLVVFYGFVGFKLIWGVLSMFGVVLVCWLFDCVLVFVCLVDDVCVVFVVVYGVMEGDLYGCVW